ncbi:PKD domain-containing protein, partial [Flavobacterium sp.]|uniref:PKD domain-containing protein n=1 Tax=Flavobacterium sp. TaxID=239 RepID=UPI003C3FC059
CTPPTYTWSVAHTPAYCGTSIVSIPSQITKDASFNFTESGTYKVTLTAINSCSPPQVTSQTITITKPPTVAMIPITAICQTLPTTTISPRATITNCGTQTPLTYEWSFPDGTPATSSSEIPGTISYSTSGTFSYSLKVTNECGTTTQNRSFTINPLPKIDGDLYSCVGFTSQLTSLGTAAATSPWVSSNSTVASVSSTGLVTALTAGTSNITYTNANNCKTTVAFTVNSAPTFSSQPIPSTVCEGGNPTVLSFVISGATGTPTYQWYSNSMNNTTSGTVISGATNDTFTPPSTSIGTFYYYCIITLPTGGCTNIKTNATKVVIEANPIISLQPTSSQNLCIGVTIPTPLSIGYLNGTGTASYQWYSNTTNATTGGTLITGATTASYTPPTYTASGNFYYYATVSLSGNGCLPATSTVAEIIVYQDPTINSEPLDNQTLCQNAIPTNLEVIATGGNGAFSYQWYSNVTNANTGGALISGATNSSFTPPTNVVSTKYYYCVVSQNATLGCTVTSAPAKIQVITAPTISQPISSIICSGGTPNPLSITVTGAVGTPQFQWYSNINNDTTTGNPISGAINSNFSPPNSDIGTIYYYCIVTLPSGGCSSLTSTTANVTITPGATINAQPTATQSLCIGATIPNPLTITYSGGTGTPTYQWFYNTTNSNTGGTAITGGTSINYTPTVFTATGSYYYYAVVSLNGNGCGPITSDVAQIIVVNAPIVTAQPLSTQTICQTATPTDLALTVSGGVGTTYFYQWYSNTNDNNTTGIAIPGEMNATYTPLTMTVGTKYYYCIITQNNGSGCNVTTDTAAVVVNLAPTFTTQPTSSNVCIGGTITPLSVEYSNGVGTPSYQWFSNSANTNSGGTAITDATSKNFSPSNSVIGTTYYYCIITLPATGGCSSISSNTATITVNPLASIDLQPLPNQTLCVGATILTPLTVTYSGGTGTPSYQWYLNTSNTNIGGGAITGATSINFTPTVFTSTGNYYYYAIITLNGNGCGAILSDPAEIIVVSDPVVSVQPLTTQILCQNASPENLTVTATGGIGTYFYQWYSNNSNSNTGGTLIPNETNDTYTPNTASVGIIYYYCMITQTGTGCNVTSAVAEVIVKIAPTISTQPASSTICLGKTPTQLNVAITNAIGTPQYQWYSNTINSTGGATPISGEINATYSPPHSTTGTVFYYCIITLPTGGCSTLTSNIATVTINPNPVIANKNIIICSGNTFTITPDILNGDIVPMGTTYTWTNPTITPINSVTGTSAQAISQNEISETLINVTTSPATVLYTVTPLSGVCAGATFTVEVVVNPAILSNTTAKNSTCFGANNGAIQTNITGGVPYNTGAPYHITWTGPNGFTSSAANISNLAPGNYNLSIEDSKGCPFTKTYVITEPDDIIITTDLEKNITCYNDANGEIKITISGGTLDYSYTWTKNGTPFASTQNLSNLSPGIYTVVVSDVNNCAPKTASYTITEPPILTVSLASKTDIVCFGDNTGNITIDVAGGTSPYFYDWKGPNGFTSSTQNITNIYAGMYDLIVTDNSGCTEALRVILLQPTEIIITATTTPIICYGGNDASINIAVSGGITPYTIGWSSLGGGVFQDNLSAGDYLVTITDANNCVKSLSVNIPEAPIFTIKPVVKNITCFGDHDGSINLNIIGGISPVKLVWDDSATAGNVRNNLGPGSYTVTITDSKPCTITKTFIILEPQLMVLSANLTHAFDCNDANSGAINLLVSGGSAPFTYTWSNGATSEDLSTIPAGNYLVTVKDVNGCTKQAQYNINRPPPLVTDVVTKTDFNCETKYVRQTFAAQVSGGVPPYQLTWSSGTVSGVNNEFMNTTQNGTVILYATDALGCLSNYTFTVAIPSLGTPSFNTSSYANLTYGIYSIHDPIQFTNTATGDYINIRWDFGDGTFSTEGNPIHTFINPKEYTVTQTVTYPYGCVYEQKTTFLVEKGYVLVVPNAFTPNNDSFNDTFRPVTKALKKIRLDIYDTWGSIIYSETGDDLRGWDGKIKGVNAENGNYYCKVSGETFYNTIINVNHPFVLIK